MTDSFQAWAEQEFDDTALPNKTITCKTLHPALRLILDALPDPAKTNAWSDELDALQQQLRECLTSEMMDRLVVLAFPNLTDAELDRMSELIRYAITLAFITKLDLHEHYYGE